MKGWNLDEDIVANHPTPDKEAEKLTWVAHMNGLMAIAEDNVLTEIVYNREILVPYFSLAVDRSHDLQ